MPAWPGFVGPTNLPQSQRADYQRCVNWYVEPTDSPYGRPGLYPMPGQRSWATFSDVGTRALFTMNAMTLGVIGGGIYELFSTQTGTKYGTCAQDSNPAQITVNGVSGNQALISSGTNAYCLNLTTHVITQVLTGAATQIGMIDGYFLAFNKVAGSFAASDLNDGLTWDPTQFAIRSSAPDNWLAMLVNAPDIWLIGEQSGDVWRDSGAFPFPFEPRSGASFPFGIAATFSITAAGDSVFWLSRNKDGAGIVVRARGYVPQPVSSFTLETAIAGYQRTSRIDDAYALSFQRYGHTFYVLTFPTANATWAYDLRTDVWIELGKENSAGNFDAWTPRAITHAFGLHLVGDVGTGRIASLDDTIGTEADGGPIVRVRVPPALLPADDGRVFVDRFTLGVEAGLGTVTGQGSDPMVAVRWSKDFGKTFASERLRRAGLMGQYGRRCFWTRCGSSINAMTPEIRVSDPIPYRITDASYQGRGVAPVSQAA